ncbi:hypothetical protein FHZ97_07545 [Listeria monocytogenes]|uniref:hypothetical protein n=1 Tax=Listeria monocytogenes TaxID=1639 RepID=UPI0011EB2B2A|nr:hypothetical protein [Listeria monocytogenes]EBF6244125.1 hypothetical protein [Listeria monocytogenes]TYU17264.1 hypothetical protein FZW73_10590 [Listeria monocytogenes]
MKIDLEQIYILESTMRLRYSPLQLRHNLKIFFIALLFVMWFQGFIMGVLPGDFAGERINMILLAILVILYILLYPRKITIKFQNLQYVLAICVYQLTIFMGTKIFYFAIFYTLKYEFRVDFAVSSIKLAYIALFVIWFLTFIVFSVHFRRRLIRGDFREGSALQKKRGNVGLKLSKGMYISIGCFFALILVSRVVGGVMEDVVYCLSFFIGILITLAGVSLFPEHLFTAYCKFKIKEFHIEG